MALELGYDPSHKGEGGLQLVSFHSVSKGFLGECGLRGGVCFVYVTCMFRYKLSHPSQ